MNNYRCGYPMQQMANRNGNCNCDDRDEGDRGALPENPVVAMAYVPFQLDGDVYPMDKALQRGTAFPVLYKPFLAGCMQ